MKVNGQEVSQEEFQKLLEDQSKGKYILKEVSPGEYRTLTKMTGDSQPVRS